MSDVFNFKAFGGRAYRASQACNWQGKRPRLARLLSDPLWFAGAMQVIGTKGQQIAEIRQKSGVQASFLSFFQRKLVIKLNTSDVAAVSCSMEVDVDKSPTGCRVRFLGTQTQAWQCPGCESAMLE